METPLAPKLNALAEQVSEVYLHFDIDALDPEFEPGAGYRCPEPRPGATALTNYNPDYEVDKQNAHRGLRAVSGDNGRIFFARS